MSLNMHLTARSAVAAAILWLAISVGAQNTTPAPSITSAASPSITAVSNCHPHGTVNWCMVGTEEYQVVGPTKTEEMEARYTGCHSHGADLYCVDSRGEDVKILVDNEEDTGETHEHEHSEPASEGTGKNCHFHAGVEHCVGEDAEEEVQCDAKNRDYNIPLRIGLLFVILVTSGIGVFGPILTTRLNLISQNNIIFIVLKQFGTGIVISTAFIHLFTHAQLMFANKCLGELGYEATTAAIFLAGLFLSFVVDYLGARFVQWRQNKRFGSDSEAAPSASDPEIRISAGEAKSTHSSAPATPNNEFMRSHGIPHAHGAVHVVTPMEEKINVMNLEAGMVFHSILIGVTLVVAGDSFFITLFIVIVFHQMFEGIALGTCIAELPNAAASTLEKLVLASIFALITPIGMAIGIGVLNKFNGNDPSTIIAIGTLDALSAGILAWVGIVEMLARDWLHGKLLKANVGRTVCAMLGLASGLVLMSVLGKWA